MNRALTTQSSILPGLSPEPELERFAESFRPQLDGIQFAVARLPSMVERQQFATRSSQIEAALRPISASRSERELAGEVLMGMLIGWTIIRNDPNAAETAAVYVKHLESIPLFAIRAACEDIKANRVYDVDQRTGNRIPLNKDHPPSTIRVRSVAQKHVDELAAQKWKFDKVLMAKRTHDVGPGPEERARVAAGFLTLSRQLSDGLLEVNQANEHVRAWRLELVRRRREGEMLEEYAALSAVPQKISGYLISPQLARRLGPMRQLRAPEFDNASGGWNRDDEH
jgi:hypothetical protein